MHPTMKLMGFMIPLVPLELLGLVIRGPLGLGLQFLTLAGLVAASVWTVNQLRANS
ncbi:MAG TPA: hypothetical protein VGK74_09905 [Symbiobacteriaceae bacterium]|jgi:hypothetical protein